jgi:hypothetical protein
VRVDIEQGCPRSSASLRIAGLYDLRVPNVPDTRESDASFGAGRAALLTTHFGDLVWVKTLLERFRRVIPEIADHHIYVIDQDRTPTSAGRLREAVGPVRILRYPVSPPHVEWTGHDHANVLNLAVRDVPNETLILFDSDAHPVGPTLRSRLEELLQESDAVLAGNGPHGTDTHPSFMVFGPTVDRARLFFDADLFEHAVDTGRKIYGQIETMHLRATVLPAEPAFDGRWGTFFLDRSVYHHGSGSFGSSADRRLQVQAESWRRRERIFRRHVLRGDYSLTRADVLRLNALELTERFVASARRIAGRVP